MKKDEPTGGAVVSFRADAELLRRLEARAADEDRKLADTVRRLVQKALGVRKGKQ